MGKEKSKDKKTECTSIFKEGKRTTRDTYTQKWIEIIEALERGK